MSVKPYSKEEQELKKASEAEATYSVRRNKTASLRKPLSGRREDVLPEGCVSSEQFWGLFEQKMREAYA